MKKFLNVLFAVLAVTAIFTSTAFAAPMDSKSVSLLSVDYNKGGVVLKFETSGLTQDDLKSATLFADSNYQDIYCTFVDGSNSIVRCTAAKSLAGDGSFVVTLAGFTFWGELPKEKLPICGEGEELWYIFEVYIDEEYITIGYIPAFNWDFLESTGFFDMLAENGGTWKITGSFCSPTLFFPL